MPPELQGYTFGKSIGRGAYGKVKKCIHDATGEPVAIKIMSYKGLSPISQLALKQYGNREMFLAQNLKHPNVICCYEAHMMKKRRYMVMEWMEGGSLNLYLKEKGGRLSEGEGRRLFRQLIHGMDYCHQQLMIHRDIKPENLLLDKSKQYLKIADFGLSNYVTDDLTLYTVCGTNLYQAPEINTLGNGYSGTKVNVYSSGVTLFHMIFGPPSPDNFGPNGLIIPPTACTSPEAKDLISRMTEREPSHRISIPEIKRQVPRRGPNFPK